MTNTTEITTARSFYAVYSPRGFANEITVQELGSAAEAKALDAGYSAVIRNKYIRAYRRMRDEGMTQDRNDSYTFLD